LRERVRFRYIEKKNLRSLASHSGEGKKDGLKEGREREIGVIGERPRKHHKHPLRQRGMGAQGGTTYPKRPKLERRGGGLKRGRLKTPRPPEGEPWRGTTGGGLRHPRPPKKPPGGEKAPLSRRGPPRKKPRGGSCK